MAVKGNYSFKNLVGEAWGFHVIGSDSIGILWIENDMGYGPSLTSSGNVQRVSLNGIEY